MAVPYPQESERHSRHRAQRCAATFADMIVDQFDEMLEPVRRRGRW